MKFYSPLRYPGGKNKKSEENLKRENGKLMPVLKKAS